MGTSHGYISASKLGSRLAVARDGLLPTSQVNGRANGGRPDLFDMHSTD